MLGLLRTGGGLLHLKKLLPFVLFAFGLSVSAPEPGPLPTATSTLQLEQGLSQLQSAEPILYARAVRGIHKWVHPPAAPAHIDSGITFPKNDGATGATQFRFTSTALIQQYPATYVWRAFWHQQTGYYTTFFYDHDGAAEYSADQGYFGCHPYPRQGSLDGDPTSGTTHNFEISCDGRDWTGQGSVGTANDSIDDNGHSTRADTGRWYRQAMTITASGGTPTVKFYFDLDAGSNYVISHTFENGTTVMPSNGVNALLGWGSSPWTGTTVTETMNGVLRGMQLYDTLLTVSNIQSESGNDSLDAAQTAVGGRHLWYIHQNLTPSDISDRKTGGTAHNPAWLGVAHGVLWHE